MKERQRNELPYPVCVQPGDTLICSVDDRKTGKTHKFREQIGRCIQVDTVVTFDVDEPMLGLVDGIGAIFGTSDEK